MEENKFDNLEAAWKKAIEGLKDEMINCVEIHWPHGTLTLQEITPANSTKRWEIIEDA